MSPYNCDSAHIPVASVYTQDAVDSQIASVTNSLNNLKAQDASIIASQVATAQSLIETSLKTSLDALPQSLLTQTAKGDLKAQVLLALKPQLDQLQEQINALKPASPGQPLAHASPLRESKAVSTLKHANRVDKAPIPANHF
jgi:Zn-dependent M16 (insulinase) family peptidase